MRSVLLSLAAALCTFAAAPASAQQGAGDVLVWRPAVGGQVPAGAIVGGARGGQEVYVCRASHDGVRVGALARGEGCEVAIGGVTERVDRYEVLTGKPWRLQWQRAEEAGGEPFLMPARVAGAPRRLCQAHMPDAILPGVEVDGRCHIPWRGKEVMARDYRLGTANADDDFWWRWAEDGWTPAGAVTASTASPDLGQAPTVCLGQLEGSWYPGALIGTECTYATGNTVQADPGYTVMIGDPARVVWVPHRNGRATGWPRPPSQLTRMGGQAMEGGINPVCRLRDGGQVLPGYEDGVACIATDGRRILRAEQYEVLFSGPR